MINYLRLLIATTFLFIGSTAPGALWSPKVDFATTNDVQFVFNWGHVPLNQSYRVVHSYRTAASFSGDHLEAYAIQIEAFPEGLLEGRERPKWAPGPFTNDFCVKALREAEVQAVSDRLTWFPQADTLNSPAFYVHFEQITLSDDVVYAARVLAYERRSKTLYFISYKH
jgi:hypothetical protein